MPAHAGTRQAGAEAIDTPSSPSHRPIRRRPAQPPMRSHLPALIYLLVALLLSLPFTEAAASCLRFADYDSINALLTEGGPNTVIQLCPNKIYRMSGPIIFTAADQEITTFGRPTDNTRATLRVQGSGETAVQGDCRRCKGVKIRNLIIDGYRQKLGRSKPTELAGPLVVLGGNEGQVVQDCVLKNPRGFTAIHVREGDSLQCKGARLVGNHIGPVGEEYDPKKDGEDPELSPLGKPLADGVSIACRDSVVKDNVFVDNTAAAIVLYCSPGTLVENNSITTERLSAMAGILLVDATPFDADYTGVVVRDNVVSAQGAGLRVGIGIGPTVWSDDTETILKGGTVVNNRLEGPHMGYGIAAAGLSGWEITGNVDDASYEGRRGDRCFPETINPDPMPFLYTMATITDSEVQEEFVDANFEYAACIDPVEPTTRRKLRKEAAAAKKPQQPKAAAPPIAPAGKAKAQVPVAAAKSPPQPVVEEEDIEDDSKPAVPMDKFDTGSVMMDGILEHSRARVIEEIEKLNQRVEGLFAAAEAGSGSKAAPKPKPKPVSPPASMAGVAGLQKRVEALEKDQGRLVEEASGLRTGMQKWNEEITKVHAWEHELLLDIQSRLHHHFLTHPSDEAEISPGDYHDDHSGHEANQEILRVPHDQAGKESRERGNLRQRSERARLFASGSGESNGWTRWAFFIALAGSLFGAWRIYAGKGKGKTMPGVTGGVGGPGVGVGPGAGVMSGMVHGQSGNATSRAGQGGAGWRRWIWKSSHRKEI